MVRSDRLCGGESGDMGLSIDHFCDRIAHLAQPCGFSLIRAQNDVVRLNLPDIEAQWQIDQLCELRRLVRIRADNINDIHSCDSSSLSFVSFASCWFCGRDSNSVTNSSTV